MHEDVREIRLMKKDFVICPRCDGDGEEPGAPFDEQLGKALCDLCVGSGEVTTSQAEEYNYEMED